MMSSTTDICGWPVLLSGTVSSIEFFLYTFFSFFHPFTAGDISHYYSVFDGTAIFCRILVIVVRLL